MEQAQFWYNKKKKREEHKIFNSFLIKANTESHLKLNIELKDGDYLLENMEVRAGVLVPNSAIKVKNNKAIIKILNVNDRDQQVAQSEMKAKLMIQELKESKCFNSKIMDCNIEERRQKVLAHIDLEGVEEQDKGRPMDLIGEFQYIFSIKGEVLSVTNLGEVEI